MSTKQHGEVVSTDHTSGNRGNHVVEGFNAVADETARNALALTAADRGRVAYQSGGAIPGWYIGQADDTWRQLILGTADSIGLYVRDADGLDSNDGSSGSPLKTLAEALRRVPTVISHAVVIHLGDGSYTLPNITGKLLSAPLALVGDGGGTGDGFTETQAPELADTGTGATTVIKIGGGLTPDAFKGHTLEITAGPGAGQRALVKRNTATAFTFAKGSLTVPPTDASTYRLVRPTVTLTFATSVQIAAPSAPNGGFAATPGAAAIVFAQLKIATSVALSQIAIDAVGVFYGVEFDASTPFVMQVSLPQFYGKETLFTAGSYPVTLFGAAADADWRGWGVYGSGVAWPAVSEFVQTSGFLVSDNPLDVGTGGYFTFQGGRIVVSSASPAVTASFGGRFVAQSSVVEIENAGAGAAVEARDNGHALVSASVTLIAPTGPLLKTRRAGVIQAGAFTGTAGGLVADAQGGHIYFTSNPSLDGGSPGSDYSAGMSSPVLRGKGDFTVVGDAISKADGSLIVRST